MQPLLQWKSGMYTHSECVCSRRYAPYNARAPYCLLWPVRLYSIFVHIISHQARFSEGKKVIEHKMCVSNFCTTFL
jgi:hypothetical protein